MARLVAVLALRLAYALVEVGIGMLFRRLHPLSAPEHGAAVRKSRPGRFKRADECEPDLLKYLKSLR